MMYGDEDDYYSNDDIASDDIRSDFADYPDYDYDNEYDEFSEENEYWDMYDDYMEGRNAAENNAFNNVVGPYYDANTGELYQGGFMDRDYGMHHGAHHGEYHDVTPQHHHTFDYLSAYDPVAKQRQDDEFFEDLYGYGEHKVHD